MKLSSMVIVFALFANITFAAKQPKCTGLSNTGSEKSFPLKLFKDGNRTLFRAEDSKNQIAYVVVPEGDKVLLTISDLEKDTHTSTIRMSQEKNLALNYEKNLKRGNPAPDLFKLNCE